MSSFSTVIPMFGTPLLVLYCMVGAASVKYPVFEGALVWVVLLGFLSLAVYFSWRLCFASTDGENLYLWSYRGSDKVSLANIKAVAAITKGRNPRIEISFRAPSKLGAKVIVIPPVGLSEDLYWDVYDLLAASAAAATHDLGDTADPRHTHQKQRKFVILIWLGIVAVALLLLCLVP